MLRVNHVRGSVCVCVCVCDIVLSMVMEHEETAGGVWALMVNTYPPQRGDPPPYHARHTHTHTHTSASDPGMPQTVLGTARVCEAMSV